MTGKQIVTWNRSVRPCLYVSDLVEPTHGIGRTYAKCADLNQNRAGTTGSSIGLVGDRPDVQATTHDAPSIPIQGDR